MDNRLIKFVQEKFSTELSAGTNVLNTMVETLAKNVDHYITRLNVSDSTSVGAVSLDPSFYPENDSSHDDSVAVVGYQQSYNRGGGGYRGGGLRGNRNFPRRGYQNQRGFQPRGRGAPRTNPNMCEYCFIQSKTRSVDFRHPIARCPEMTAMHGAVNLVDYEYGDDQELYEDSAREFFAEQDWHEAATVRQTLDNIVSPADINDLSASSDNESSSDASEDVSAEYNAHENYLPSVNLLKTTSIPSILEIVDFKNKIYKVSAVALKKAPIMMCYYEH